MADLRVDNPRTTEEFCRFLARQGVTLPIDVDETCIGTIIDATGAEIAVVDKDREQANENVLAIAMMIVCAVNTCGGFVAERGDG